MIPVLFNTSSGAYNPADESGALLALDWRSGISASPIATWQGQTNSAAQGSASLRPVLTATGVQWDGLDDYLALPSELSLGDFTVYVAGTLGGLTGSAVVLGNATGANDLIGVVAGSIFVDVGAAGYFTEAYTGTTGTFLWRFRRTTTTAKFVGTSMAEATLSVGGGTPGSGTIDVTWLGLRSAFSTITTNNVRIKHLLVYNADLPQTNAAADARIRNWLYLAAGVSL